MRNVSDKTCKEIKTGILFATNFCPNLVVDEIM
jgi:hypothetical protein